MTLQGNYSLAAHASRTETFPADGSTWRLQSEQEPNAPGAAMPSVAVEGCATGGGPFSTGFVTQWPNENGSPFWERDCHTLINSYDPNAKQAARARAQWQAGPAFAKVRADKVRECGQRWQVVCPGFGEDRGAGRASRQV